MTDKYTPTPIQRKIEEVVTDGRGYEPRGRELRGLDSEPALCLSLLDMDMYDGKEAVAKTGKYIPDGDRLMDVWAT